MVANEPLEARTLVIGEVFSQVIEDVNSVGHLEHCPESIERLDRNRLEPLVVVRAEDLRSPADVVAMNEK